MKQYKLIILAVLLSFCFMSCKKTTTDQVMSSDQLGIGSYLWLDSAGSLNLNYAAISTSVSNIYVHGVGEPISKIISYVSNSNNSINKSTWKKIKETTPTDNKATISVSGTELAAALGVTPSALSPGVQYTIFNEVVTTSGKVYNINNTNSEFESAPDYHVAFRFTISIVCPFVSGTMTGTYKVIADPNWQDWSPGDLVQVTEGPGANQVNISKVYPNPAYGSVGPTPLVVDVDPATGAASIKTGSATNYWGNYGSYVTYAGSGSSGFVFSCTGRISLKIHIIATVYGDQGYSTLILQKQ